MAVSIRELLGLEVMRQFKVVAGEKGLDRTVTATEILDFEFIQEGEEYRQNSFNGDSLVLSSFLFAKDKPELILDTVKRLIQQNVQALAYKPVFFKKLPQEALQYADRMNFPILEFGRDEFFEDIIFTVKKTVEQNDILTHSEALIEEILTRDLSPKEAEDTLEKLNPLLCANIAAVCIRGKNMTAGQVRNAIHRGKPDLKLSSKFFIAKYKDSFIVLLSQDKEDSTRLLVLLDDVLLAYGLMGKELTMGFSRLIKKEIPFDRAVRQAFWTEKVAEIEKKSVKYYKDLGIYKLIIPDMHRGNMREYMQEYLAPVFEDEDKGSELLRTAVEYILANGDTIKTAERLFCHRNTIRYRIGKLQEKLDPDANEKEFYQNLAAAIKIYLLNRQ